MTATKRQQGCASELSMLPKRIAPEEPIGGRGVQGAAWSRLYTTQCSDARLDPAAITEQPLVAICPSLPVRCATLHRN